MLDSKLLKRKDPPRRVKGDDCRHSIAVDGEPLLRLKYKGGAVTREQMFVGAVAVIRGVATVVDGRGKPIAPKLTVICRRNCFNGALKQFRLGVPVETINPGHEYSFFVLPKGAESNPGISKSMCRPVQVCTDNDETCRNCCNNRK